MMDDRELLRCAALSKQTPSQSGYHVRTAGLTQRGRVVLGGNMEYGICSAIHGEESVIANWLQACCPDDRLATIAFASENDIRPDDPYVTSCGNCRDLVKEYCDPAGSFLEGNPEGLFRRYPFSKLYFDAFHPVLDFSDDLPFSAVESSIKAAHMSYDIYTGGTYGASIVTRAGVFSAGVEGDVAYHPTLPIRNAITCLKYSSKDWRRFDADAVVLAGPKALEVPYKDRQYLFEFVENLRAADIRKAPIDVYLIQTSEMGDQKGARKTDSDEWLPFPFSPAVLGMDEKMREYMRRHF